MEGQWERGRQAMQQSLDLAKAGEAEQALNVLDSALAQATEENRGMWIAILCRHAAVFAHVMGDPRREIRYTEQALPRGPAMLRPSHRRSVSRTQDHAAGR